MSKDEMRRLIVVVGMHRSGTSSVTRALKVLGADLGTHFLPAGAGNEKGYWEDADIQALNVEILAVLDSDWYCLTPIISEDIETLTKLGFRDRAVSLLSQKIQDTSIFGIKDPRLAKLLPFWESVFAACDCTVHYVFPIRNPMSVANSLKNRDGLELAHGYLLWLTYVLTGLNGNSGDNPVLIDYDRLINFPLRELHRLGDELGLELDSERLEIYETEFLDTGLRHFEFGLSDLMSEQDCPLIVRDIYAHLLAVASAEQKIDHQKMSAWTLEVEKLVPLFRYIDRLNRQIDSLLEPHPIAQTLYIFGRSIFRVLPFSERIGRLFRH